MLYTVWSKHENEEEICINLNPFLGNDLNTKQILWEFKRFSLMRHYLIKKPFQKIVQNSKENNLTCVQKMEYVY